VINEITNGGQEMYGMDEDRKEESPTIQLLEIVGMSCSHCESAVSGALRGLAGVSHVSVDVAAGTALVESSQPLDMGLVAAAIDDAGYQLRQRSRRPASACSPPG
jgi:copper chaperone